MKGLRIDPGAREELRDAAAYYNRRQPRLGDALLSEATETFRLIVQHPRRGRIVEDDVRQVRQERFPYYVIFVERESHVFVAAFMHQRREPGYWRSRLRN